MRVLFVFGALLVATAYARPQYNYGLDSTHIGLAAPKLGSVSEHNGGEKYLPPASTTLGPIITKQFFLHSAPENNEGIKTKHFVLGRPQKNYRVVFIKAPTSENDNIRFSAEYAPNEDKTVIYVLSKKEHELDVNDIATPEPTKPSKPEVFFIKYKTPEEAAAAQQTIQDQYDSVGGTSEFTDEGVAPISSAIGSLDGLASDGGYNYQQINSAERKTQLKRKY